MKQFFKIIKTDSNPAGLVSRITLAVVLFPHGCQHLLGWFDGHGFAGTMNFFTNTIGLPWIIGFLVIFLEFFGSLFILAGLGSRLIAPASIIMFTGMILTGHLEQGFFMNWMGTQGGEGFEYHLLAIGLLAALMASGSGRYSLDRLITLKLTNHKR